jgi:HD-like signal output (HDOD) protein
MTRILLITGDSQEMAELKRGFRNCSFDWEISFQSSLPSPDAKTEPCDVVVLSEGPEISAVKALTQLSQQFPNAVRILMVKPGSQMSQDKVCLAHQYLAKPCEPNFLNEAIDRAKFLRDLLANAKFRNLVSQVKALPTMPSIYVEVMRELRTEDPSVIKLSYLISQDPGMCAKLIQMVNSPFFGLQGNVTNPADAIFHLGMNAVKQLVLSIGILTSFENKPGVIAFDRLWSHSWATGALARKLAQREMLPDPVIENAFLSGLLHDVGKLVLATGLRTEYTKVQQHRWRTQVQLSQAELELLGATHAEIGAYLLGLWGLPTKLIEAVATHHRPVADKKKKFSLVTALHVADCLEQETRSDPQVCCSKLDMAYLAELGLVDRIEDWRKVAFEGKVQKAA